jgi:hypothetical protein
MNIDDMTIGQFKTLSALLSGPKTDATFTPHIGKICIIRAYASGVFMGKLVAQSGRMVELQDSRRLWSWKARESISLSAVATSGVDPSKCRFPQVVPEETILDVIEIIPASAAAIASINSVPVSDQR